LQIFVFTGRFADENELGIWIPLTKDKVIAQFDQSGGTIGLRPALQLIKGHAVSLPAVTQGCKA